MKTVKEIIDEAIPIKVWPPESGIYFLYRDNEIVYIGKSNDIYFRISTHISEGKKIFDRASFIRHPVNDNLPVLEKYLIETFLPEYNKDMATQKIKNAIKEKRLLSEKILAILNKL